MDVFVNVGGKAREQVAQVEEWGVAVAFPALAQTLQHDGGAGSTFASGRVVPLLDWEMLKDIQLETDPCRWIEWIQTIRERLGWPPATSDE